MLFARTLLLGTLLCSAAAAPAAPLSPGLLGRLSFDEVHTLGLNGVPATAIDLFFSYSLAPGGVTDLSTRIFDGRLFDADDVGQTFTLSPSDPAAEAGLSAFLARLTNGIDDDVRDDAIGNNGGGVGLVGPESQRIEVLVARSGPDLTGYAVSALELFIAELFIDPAAGGDTPHWRIGGELRFIGTPAPVPVPAAGLLFAAAVGGLALHRRRSVTAR